MRAEARAIRWCESRHTLLTVLAAKMHARGLCCAECQGVAEVIRDGAAEAVREALERVRAALAGPEWQWRRNEAEAQAAEPRRE